MTDMTDVRAGQVEGAAAAASARGGASAPSNSLTVTHRKGLDEARMILNMQGDVSLPPRGQGIPDEVKRELVERYERLFVINAPPAPKGKQGGGQGSFYIQSKIVRARERIEAEWALQAPPPQAS